ncbi:LemA family protein [Candidatus Saccharibacteria bacterium]|nr:LemA family protein [Candidatus Saccharibacteria bacterium]MCL1962732.1 LemA family protein [Candidatus Saccharibacteria bacterium]
MPTWGWIIIAIVVVIIFVIVGIYNGLVKLKVRVDEAWSDITVQLKRRADLIPNLVESVKGYAKHEKEVFENVAAARAAVMAAAKEGPAATAKAENQFEGALKTLFAVAENYPQLKANENFLQLQQEITDTEDKVQASRRFYNGGVRELNTKIQTFPSNIFASIFGFTKREFFEVADRAAIEEAPKVNF